MSESDNGRKLDFGTRVIHGGQRPDPLTGAVMTPIYLSSTYVQDSPGVHKGYDYARTRNPTRDALQAALANLENGTAGVRVCLRHGGLLHDCGTAGCELPHHRLT